MDAEQLLMRFDRQVRRDAAPERGTRVERRSSIVRVVGTYNCIRYHCLTDASADREIERQVRHFDKRAEPIEWKVYGHDLPTDLGRRLSAAGFEPDVPETLAVLDLARPVPEAPLPGDVSIRRISSAEELEDFIEVESKAFDADQAWLFDTLLPRLGDGTVSMYVAYRHGDAACAGRMETPRDHEFAGLFGGGTVPAHRGRGLYRALVAARAREAVDRGYRYLTVEARATSLPILQRLGFVPLTSVVGWVREPRGLPT